MDRVTTDRPTHAGEDMSERVFLDVQALVRAYDQLRQTRETLLLLAALGPEPVLDAESLSTPHLAQRLHARALRYTR